MTWKLGIMTWKLGIMTWQFEIMNWRLGKMCMPQYKYKWQTLSLNSTNSQLLIIWDHNNFMTLTAQRIKKNFDTKCFGQWLHIDFLFVFSLVANVNNNINNNNNNANKNNINAINQDSNNVASNTNAVNQIMVRGQ